MKRFFYYVNAVCEIAMLAMALYFIIVGDPAEASLCVGLSIVNSRAKESWE